MASSRPHRKRRLLLLLGTFLAAALGLLVAFLFRRPRMAMLVSFVGAMFVALLLQAPPPEQS